MADVAQGDEHDWTRMGISEAAYAALSEGITASELWSLLLGVVEQRASQRAPADIRHQWQRDRFVAPAPIVRAGDRGT